MSQKFLIQPGFDRVAQNINQKLDGYVPHERTINGKPLSEDVTLTANDVGAVVVSQLDDAIRTNIRTKWRSGWPEVWANPIADTGRANLARAALPPNYGVTWDGSSTTKWTRTGESKFFSDPVPYVAGATEYGSPFDSIMPWAGMVKEERAGGTMVAIPKFWYKLEQNADNPGMSIKISNEPIDGFSVSPAHMDKGDGKGERDVVYVGRYHCAYDWKSKADGKPVANISRDAARINIHALGADIWQSDFAMRFTIWLLYLVEFADWDSQKAIGAGCGNNRSTWNMGYTDSMPYHTGTTQSSRDTFGLGTQYRNIEGLWDNVYDWMDGCYYNSNGLNIILNPNNFSDTTGGFFIGKPSSGYPTAFSVKSVSGSFPAFIPTAAAGSDASYSCDTWFFHYLSSIVYTGGSYSTGKYDGLFAVGQENNLSYTSSYYGCRIQELP